MKFLSFKILILCILLPPVLYVLSIQHLEEQLRAGYAKEIEEIYIGDTRPLLAGSVRLRDAIEKNIDLWLQNKSLISWGVKVSVTVVTKKGEILYPPVFEEEEEALRPLNLMKTAGDNYRLMNEGPEVNLDLNLGHGTPISVAILAGYVLIFLLVLYFYYRAGVRKARQAELETNKEIEKLRSMEDTHTEKLKALAQEREKLSAESKRIKKALENEKVKASKNEEEMIEEIVKLEEKFKKNLALQQEQEEEINALKEEIKELEGKTTRKESKPRLKDIDAKRFRTLYKNISISDRAISGFAGLSDELKIKSEEVIHQLNENPDLVTIKRKVFGKKSKHTVLEVIYGYKGRLYFCKTKDNRIEVLAIGTKNSQTKDLEFLDNLNLK